MNKLKQHELALVMPVYNEEECILDVVHAWRDELSRLSLDFFIIVLNDGSTDGSLKQMEQFSTDTRIRFINKENTGHGPTILMGYRMAVKEAEWVFQTDSDNEMSPSYFREMWLLRSDYDALFGLRKERKQGLGRKLISAFSRLVVRILFTAGVNDVNTPYRLLRAQALERIVMHIPDDTFAPNIIISGEFAASGARILNLPVPHEGRNTGSPSVIKWRLLEAVVKSFVQIVNYRYHVAKKIVMQR